MSKVTRWRAVWWIPAAALLLAVLGPRPGAAASAAGAGGWPPVEARSVVVLDAGSGRVLHAVLPDERHLIASTTKIMTALVALERGNPDDLVTVSRRAASVEGSSAYLEEGERQTLRDLLYALILRSANDAAVALAEHVGGSVEGFAGLMNARSRDLGCLNTHFVNPHGLDDPEHYSTARDLATMAAYALKNPAFRQLVSTRRWQMPWPAKDSTRVLYSENKLLAYEDGTGVKTGYTVAAGHCVVASARRGQFEPVVVLLGAGMGFWKDVRALLDHAFARYRPVTIVRVGQPIASRPLTDGVAVQGVAGGDAVVALLPEEASSLDGKVATVVQWEPGLQAPVGAGQRVGEARVTVDCPGVPPLTVPLLAGSAVALPPRPASWPWLTAVAAVGLVIWGLRRRARRSATRRGWSRTGSTRAGSGSARARGGGAWRSRPSGRPRYPRR